MGFFFCFLRMLLGQNNLLKNVPVEQTHKLVLNENFTDFCSSKETWQKPKKRVPWKQMNVSFEAYFKTEPRNLSAEGHLRFLQWFISFPYL